ncbi:MAG: hypothetical protein L6R41_006624 [Letrouitia leprolyta]|nr:MAG: hypothetical protein L6R41_006624 [Letrouitia leprolyta]
MDGGDVYYKSALNRTDKHGTWSGSLDILGAEDFYERTGDPEKKTLVYDLLKTWLKYNPTPWSWDGWNDDIGWFTLALVRGYQITGNQTFLGTAKYGFDYAFGRGWDTQHNDGGIWEENPEYTALSNDSLGKVAAILYQTTHDQGYLQKAVQIYAWVKTHLVNAETGQVNRGVDQNGKVDTGTAVYNQGTFVDYANLLYETTGNQDYYDDAKKAIDFAKDHLTMNGIFSNKADYLNTWADEMARGIGHFVRDNRLWDIYHPWMLQNANAILKNRRPDLNITWNAWDQPTPNDNSLMANDIGGIRTIQNKQTGLVIDSAGTYGNGKPAIQWGLNNTDNKNLNQRWLLTQNSDNSWNIVNLATWQALDCPGGKDTENLTMIQWFPHRGDNQRWWIDRQDGDDGEYKIWNQGSGKALDGGLSKENGAMLLQRGWDGCER